MMRHTINIKEDPELQKAELASCLPGLQDGDCVKLTQAGHYLYLTYRLSERMGQKDSVLAMQLMRLNGIEEGSCVVEACLCARIEHLRVKVSPLDWKIVNLNQIKIAQSFLEQIRTVWPAAVVPIYYDDLNFVSLLPLCDKVGRLDVNTTVEFIEEEEEGSSQRRAEQQEALESKEDLESSLVMRKHCDFKDGWLNVINVSSALLKDMQIEDQQPWVVENLIEFAGCPKIEELMQLQKTRETDKQAGEPSNKKLVLLVADDLSQLSASQFCCSKLCKKVVGVADRLKLSNNPLNKPEVETMSFQILMKDPNWSIQVTELIRDESLYSEIEFQQAKSTVTKHFILDFMNTLHLKGSFFVLQDHYPYCLQGTLFLVRLEHKNNKNTKQIYQIKLTGKDSPAIRESHEKELAHGKVIFSSRRYPPSLPSTLEQRYEDISQWVQVLMEFIDEEGKKKSDSKEDSLATLFTNIYRPEIDKMMNFLGNQSQSSCLVTSFGNNGKTFLHWILEQEGEKMWKVSFRDLIRPSLSYANIQFYLHWIFANSPYPVIFLDDLDSLCPKVEEGDQHKKKEKIISRLLLRTISRHSQTYSRRIIATAKSEGSLDEDFRSQTVITLRNPSRELREAALKELHVVIQPDDSPIHNFANLPKSHRPTQEKVTSIAEQTESLTLGAFSRHAIDLTTPSTAAASSVSDFSKLAGLSPAKTRIRSIIEKPIKYAFLFKSVPIKLPRGVLLYGATGNGKSALGNALKDEFKMKYFSVKGSDILSKYIGGSEAAVRDIFEKALSVSPSIIFFDEFESIVPKRSSNNTGVNDRIVNQFLCYLDGVSSMSGVYIIAASSRPDLIDPAVLRPGRLDAHLFLDYPDEGERRELIHLFAESVKIEVDQADIVKATENFSYSDLIGLMKELRIKRSVQVLKQETFDSSEFTKISEELFHQTMQSMKLSVNASDQGRQRDIYESFRDGKAPEISKQRQILM